VAADDTEAMADTARAAEVTLGGAATVVGTSQEVIRRLGGDAGVTADALERVEAAREDAAAVSTGTDEERAARATALAATLQMVSAEIPQIASVDPAVLVRPFEADTRNISAVRIEPIDYFAPSSVALLLQHLAVTFAALSLVRDRELGLLELLRVGPLSSMEILVGKTIAYLLVGIAVGAALVAGAVLLLGVPLQGELAWVGGAVVLVLLASLMLGTVLSMISGSETQAVQFSMLTLLAGMFFSGFILDADQLAAPYRYLSALLPVTYGINILQDVMLRGVEPAREDLIGIGALVLAYGALAVLLLRRRLRTG
jgi:ABC-2 type transport system permease protein